jgi:hypothetical protein
MRFKDQNLPAIQRVFQSSVVLENLKRKSKEIDPFDPNNLAESIIINHN